MTAAKRPVPPPLRAPHIDRLEPARPDYQRILQAHEAAMAASEPFYLDPVTGLAVFTAQALWDRGFCCDSGCRHCPYLERASR